MSLFGSKKPPTAAPEPVAPVPDEELDQIAQQRDYQRRYGGKGRSGGLHHHRTGGRKHGAGAAGGRIP